MVAYLTLFFLFVKSINLSSSEEGFFVVCFFSGRDSLLVFQLLMLIQFCCRRGDEFCRF